MGEGHRPKPIPHRRPRATRTPRQPVALARAWNTAPRRHREGDRMSSLAGRVALVTGAGGGIGLGIARRLAAAGATIVVAEIDADAGAAAAGSIAEEFGVATHFVATDVTRR